MVIFLVSWRNVWRNKLRSLIIISAIAIGVFAGVFTTAFMQGMSEQRVEAAIKTEISFIQLHNPKFKEAQDIDALIKNVNEKKQKISEIKNVSGQSERIVINGMAASAETSSGVRLYGINTKDEIKVTNINEKLIEGKFLEGIKRNPVVIGHKLAEKLNLKLRSKIIFTFQDFEGNLTGGAFRIAGIYRTDNAMFDGSTIFVKKSDLQRLTMLPENTAHEIVVNIDNQEADKTVKAEIEKQFTDVETKLWTELKPELAYLTEVMGMYMYIFVGIILFALGFGIVNTMLMVVLERVKEIGMLLAVGMNKMRVFSMIVLETVFLSLTGGIVGIVLGGLVSKYYSTNAIDLSMWSEGLGSIGWGSKVFTSIGFEMLISITLMVIATGIIAAIYPARKALKLNPADALRTE